MPTPKQITFLYETGRLEMAVIRKMTDKEASEAVGEFIKAYNENKGDIYSRERVLNRLREKLNHKFGKLLPEPQD